MDELISAFGSEINVLLDVDINDIAKITAPAITDAIQAFREKKSRNPRRRRNRRHPGARYAGLRRS
jgi:hypothetical protein